MTQAISGQTLHTLTAGIIDTPQDDQAWEAAFRALQSAVPAQFAALLCVNPADPRFDGALSLLAGAEASLATRYVAACASLNPHRPRSTSDRLRSVQGCLHTSEVMSDAQRQAVSFHHREIASLGDLENGLWAIQDLGGGAQLHFVLMRGREPHFSAQEREFCDLFLRTACSALRQRLLLQQLERERAIGIGLAENSGDAVFVLDRDCRPGYMNAAAHNWLEHAAVVVLHGGQLQFQHAADSHWLRTETASLLPSDATNGGDSLRYRRIDAGDRITRLYAVLSRLPILPSLAARRSAPRVALYLRCVEEALPQLRPQDLAALFGFTPTESRVVSALLLGITAEQMATQWGIRSDTVRGHLKRVLAKTHCSRQQELIQIISTALPHLILMNDSTD